MIVTRPQTPPARRWLAHLVCAAASPSTPVRSAVGPPPGDGAGILDLARRQGVTPLLHAAATGGGLHAELPDDFRRACEADYYDTLRRNVAGLKTGRRVLAGLRCAGIDAAPLGPWSLLDGALPFHADVGVRPLGSLELMVRESQLRAAQVALEELGFRRHPIPDGARSLDLDDTEGAAEASLRLHWRFDAGRNGTRADPVSGDAFLDALCDTTVSGRTWATRFALLASASLRALRAAPSRWVDLADVHRVVTALPLDWDDVVAAARRWRLTAPLYAGLVATRSLLATPVPRPVLEQLAPGPVRRRLLDRSLAGPESARGAVLPAHALAVENWWELARATARAAASRSISKSP